MKLTRILGQILLPTVVLLLAPAAGRAETLRESVARLSADVASSLREEGDTTVRLGKFTAPPMVSSTIGLRQALKDALASEGISLSSKGNSLDARFSVAEDGDQLLVLIEALLLDANGKPLHRMVKRTVTEPADVAEFFGLTVGLADANPATPPAAGKPAAGTKPITPPAVGKPASDAKPITPPAVGKPAGEKPATPPVDGNPPASNTAVAETASTLSTSLVNRQALQNPGFFSTGTAVASSAGSPYRVELLSDTGSGFLPVPVTDFKGRAFSELPLGRPYRVRITNNTPHDAAVRIALDGINCFTFSEVPDYRANGVWIVRANSALVVDGWYISPGVRDQFMVVPDEESVAAGFGADQSTMGVVTCSFFAAWESDQPVPPIEPAGARGGTAQGPRVGGAQET
ncbi:MAG: hypothetical protein KDA79_24565, partial [Planctomycetaceae bacterium]|nr:hypothetical protein [Planctomycetaceae bacterium]